MCARKMALIGYYSSYSTVIYRVFDFFCSSVDKLRVHFERHDSKNVDFKVMHVVQGRETEDINIGIMEGRGRNGISTRTFFRENMMLDLSVSAAVAASTSTAAPAAVAAA